MPATYCRCGRELSEATYLCPDCVNTLWRNLAQIPNLIPELVFTLSKRQRFDHTPASKRTRNELPFDLAASRILADLEGHLVWMHRNIAGTEAQPEGSVVLARKLMPLVDRIAALPWAPTAMDLVRLVERSAAIIDRPPERIFVGPCDDCGVDLYTVGGSSVVHCPRCQRSYDVRERRAWLLDLVEDQLATAVAISRALTSLATPVTPERIRQWKARGRIAVHGHSRDGRPLYRIGDVIDLLTHEAAA